MEVDFKKWLDLSKKIIPIVALVATGVLWVDARHMHKDMADLRWLDVQILIINGHILDYTRIKDPTTADKVAYELSKDRLNFLMEERSDELGGLPQ